MPNLAGETYDWSFATFSPAIANGNVSNGQYEVSISNGGNNVWDINLGQEGIEIEQGEEYFVTFDAYGSAVREISAFVGQNTDPWTVYSDGNPILLSEHRQTFNYSFIMENTSDIDARFGFDLGGSSEDVTIDNVYLSTENPLSTIILPGRIDTKLRVK